MTQDKRKFPLGYKLYRLQLYLHQVVHNFRKEYKYDLGGSLLEKGWQTMDAVYQANNLPPKQRKASIIQASTYFDQLKNRVKMAHDLKLISHKQLGHIIKQGQEIGKMLAGWKRWAQKQA